MLKLNVEKVELNLKYLDLLNDNKNDNLKILIKIIEVSKGGRSDYTSKFSKLETDLENFGNFKDH